MYHCSRLMHTETIFLDVSSGVLLRSSVLTFVRFGGKVRGFQIHYIQSSFFQGFCDGHNAHLAYVESADENNFIKKMIDDRFDDGKVNVLRADLGKG